MKSFHVHLWVYDVLKGERQCKKKSKGREKGEEEKGERKKGEGEEREKWREEM